MTGWKPPKHWSWQKIPPFNPGYLQARIKCELRAKLLCFRRMQQGLGNENPTQRRGDAESAKDENNG